MRELKGQYFWKTPWGDHSEDIQEKLKIGIEKARGGDPSRFEALHYGEDGTKVKVDFSLRPVMDEDGRIIRLLAEGKNVTDI
ncbi:MAG: hypothetical protein ACOC53_03535 [Candidatus Saliniplasma sp.]